jgi:hypothetical protein
MSILILKCYFNSSNNQSISFKLLYTSGTLDTQSTAGWNSLTALRSFLAFRRLVPAPSSCAVHLCMHHRSVRYGFIPVTWIERVLRARYRAAEGAASDCEDKSSRAEPKREVHVIECQCCRWLMLLRCPDSIALPIPLHVRASRLLQSPPRQHHLASLLSWRQLASAPSSDGE